ncbi:CapA family protein [Ileibacterium valens]|uniref:CapA family protein n=1 Tax=Ileibacterium valens TaxID=1862668 RepID=UPI00259B2715|nr:CapA family protein [Ileibacterium valens]
MAKKKKKIRKIHAGLLAITGIIALSMLSVFAVSKIFSPLENQNEEKSNEANPEVTDDSVQNTDSESTNTGRVSSFTFTGVGDNLLHDPIFLYFEEDTGTRDFLPIYEATMDKMLAADLAYINFETLCAGDEYGLSGYPDFNGPVEMIDALAQTGIDWISTASNHSLDRGPEGLMTQMSYLQEHYPAITYTGSYMSEEAYNTPIVKEINGIKVGMATFTYGLNGRALPEGYEWLVDVYDEMDGTIKYDRMQTVLDRLKDVSDVQIVTMHWGVEYENTPNEEQVAIAQFLHQNGVEAIIGTHPHVIQPAEMLVSDDQTTLVYYSLGNFLSAQNTNMTMVGGMADFTLNYNFDSKKASFSDVKFIPTITWISPDLRSYQTHTIDQWDDNLSTNHYVTQIEGMDLSKGWVQEYVQSVMGTPENIEIVYE